MQAQVPADGGPADAGTQEERRRLERAAGHDHARRAHADARGAARVGVGVGALDARRTPVLDEHTLGGGAHEHAGAGRESVGEVGLGGRELRARLVAKADVAGGLGRIAARVDVARDRPERPAEGLGAAPHRLLGPVQVRAAVVHAEPLPDGVEVAVEVRARKALEAVLAFPLLAHPRLRAQAVRPVDRGAPAVGGARVQRDVHVGRGVRAPAPVHVLVGPQLVLVEVALVVEAARLQHEHLEPGARELARDHAAPGTRADHHDVGVIARLVALGHERLHVLLPGLGRAAGAGVAERRPERVAPAGVRHAVGEEEREADERLAARGGLRAEQGEIAKQLLARAPGRAQEAHLHEAVAQRPEPVALEGRQALDRGGERLVRPHVGARARPEPVRVGRTIERRAGGIADRAQDVAPEVVHRATVVSHRAPVNGVLIFLAGASRLARMSGALGTMSLGGV